MSCGEPGFAAASDGTKIGWFRSGEGPPLVLVHGTTADHSRWAPVLEHLATRATVYAVDRRGRGASGDTDDGEYRTETEFGDTASVVDAIDGPVTLLGHSFGGLCALEAATRTSNVGALILYEPYFETGYALAERAVMERVKDAVATGDRERALVTFMREVVGLSEEAVEDLRRSPSWQARIAAAHTIPREDEVETAYHFDPSRFEQLTTPTLLLAGEISPRALTEPINQLSGVLPDARVVVMEGQHHVAMNTAPDLFARAVLDFLPG
ncbi:MAG TPA: alpha/beta hydrolase [Actinomycetota bacterium]